MKDPLRILEDTEQPEPRRIEAAKSIAKAKDLAAIDRMLAVTERSEALLIRAVVDSLKEMGAADVLAKRLGDPDASVRADAARKLGKMQDERAADALIRAARDPEAPVRRAAVNALSLLRTPKVFEALAAALRDADPETRAYAAAGIGRSADARAEAMLKAARDRESDDTVKDFIEAALRKLPRE